MAEAIVVILPDVRTAYSFIPMACVLLFLFSGLIFKPSTLDSWLAPWLPSVSVLRWYTQGGFLNQYSGDTEAFPTISNDKVSYSSWEAVLNIFGWGGKSKWYCLQIVAVNLAVFRVLKLLVWVYTVASQRGKRGLRKKIFVERIY
jgi:hypothetical protein